MNKKHLVILGGGFAGLRAVYHLHKLEELEITLIDSRSTSLEKPSLPEVALAGKPVQHVQIPLQPILNRHGVRFIEDTVTLIDPKKNQVHLSNTTPLTYDYLLIALGAVKNYDAIPGFREFGYSVCDDEQASRLHERLMTFTGGSIVIGAARSSFGKRVAAPNLAAPCEGPIGEVMFMLDYELRRRGLREKSTFHIFTPGAEFFEDVGAPVHAAMGPLIEKHGMTVHVSKTLKQIFADHVEFSDGSMLEADLTVIIPPYTAPAAIKESGLGDEAGFVPTDTQMRHLDYPNIFAAGDVNALAMPKLGHIAVHQADIASAAIHREVTGAGDVPQYAPEIFCIMNRGGDEATLILSDFLYGGKRDIAFNSPVAHLMKWSFDSYYFFTKGHLPPEAAQSALETILERMR